MDVSSLVPVEVKPNMPDFGPGDTVKVSIRLKEGENTRTQNFQGLVIAVKKGGNTPSFTVRRAIYGIGVERTFYYNSPTLEKVELLREGRVRRAKLYFVRGLSSRQLQAKVKAKGREAARAAAQEAAQEAAQAASQQAAQEAPKEASKETAQESAKE